MVLQQNLWVLFDFSFSVSMKVEIKPGLAWRLRARPSKVSRLQGP